LSKHTFSESHISERIALLTDIAHSLIESGVIPDKTVVLREGRITQLVRGYFLLNAAYKDWRISEGHHTEKPKIAALQATVISSFQPFKPLNPADTRTIAEARCNEIYAMAFALSILEVDFQPDTVEKKDFLLRLLEIISHSEIQTLEPFVQDVNLQIQKPLESYTLSILPIDKLPINSLISIFELISKKGELLK
jgi:hypothetical protein